MTTKTKKAKLADFTEQSGPATSEPVVEQAQPEITAPEPEPAIAGDSSAAAQMVARADETIAQLELQLADIAQQITSVHIELETFPQNRQERAGSLRDARDVLRLVEDSHTKAVAYAKLAHGTLNEQASIKAVSTAQKEVKQAEEKLALLKQEVAEADQTDQDREQELTSTLETLRAEQERLQAELYNTRDARMQAYAELGEQRYRVIHEQVQGHQERIDALKSQLIAAQVEFHDYLLSALPLVQDWREHRQKIGKLIPAPEDATSRVIAASMHFMETLLRERFELKEHQPQANWLGLLIVDGNDLTYITDRIARKEHLENRLSALKRLQSEYADHLARS